MLWLPFLINPVKKQKNAMYVANKKKFDWSPLNSLSAYSICYMPNGSRTS